MENTYLDNSYTLNNLNKSGKFLSNMFKRFVRLHLKYYVQLWKPVYIGEISLMEKSK